MVKKQSLVPALMECISLWGAQEMRNQKITMPALSAGMGGMLGALGAHLDFMERQRRHPVEMAERAAGKRTACSLAKRQEKIWLFRGAEEVLCG